MTECKYLRKNDVDKTLTIICDNPYLNMINKKKDHSVLCFNSDTCPKFEPVDSIDDEGRSSMDKCIFVKVNPLIDSYICNEPSVNAAAPGECVICNFHKTGTQYTCPRAKFHDDISEGTGNDHVNHPDHYNQGNIECIDAIEASMTPKGFQDFCKGNNFKYLWRWDHKGGTEDLKKARFYLNRMIQSVEKEKTE